MTVTAIPARSSRRRARTASREQDATNPARGIMVGLGLSALLWTSIGAFFLR